MIKKLISGGQTGADRAALDVAIQFNIPHGGWIPKGRKAEDGTLINLTAGTRAYRPNLMIPFFRISMHRSTDFHGTVQTTQLIARLN